MDSEITQLEGTYRLWAWADKNKKQLTWAAIALVVVGLGVYYHTWKTETAEKAAAEELSQLRPTATPSGVPLPVRPDDYLKIANAHPGTQAAGRAVLLAGASFFADHKYAEARTQFDRFLREFPASPLRGEALFGLGTCLEVEGKTAEAQAAYKDLLGHHSSDPVTPRAKLALARTCEAQKQTDQARRLYEELSQTESFNSVGLMADVRLGELKLANPNLAVGAGTNTPSVTPPAKGSNLVPAVKPGASADKANQP